MRRSATGTLAALLVAATTALAASGGIDRPDGGAFARPSPNTRTVAPHGPGQDYKSNPAEPEQVEPEPVVAVGGIPIKTFSLVTHGAETLEAAVVTLNPSGDPSVVICEEEDGSFTGVNARWAIPPSERPPDGVSCAALLSG